MINPHMHCRPQIVMNYIESRLRRLELAVSVLRKHAATCAFCERDQPCMVADHLTKNFQCETK